MRRFTSTRSCCIIMRGVSFYKMSILGAGLPGPVESFEVSKLPAWGFLGLGDSDVETALEITTERIEAARAFAG